MSDSLALREALASKESNYKQDYGLWLAVLKVFYFGPE
jgi:hypothetical protein